MGSLKIVYRDPAGLRPRSTNPRTHSPKQIKQIAASVEQFGFLNAVLIDRHGGIIAGHGRVEAAKSLGMTAIPTVCVDNLNPTQLRAFVIADNKIAENAGWDPELLALELQELSVQLNFDVTVTGFETAEVDILVGELNQESTDEADLVLTVDRSGPAVSRLGDIWHIGNHVLICGNALDKRTYQDLLGSRKAQMIFTDPPYNVPIARHVSGKGKVTHCEFVMASGEMSASEFTKFLNKAFEQLVFFSTSGSIHFICMDWRHMREVLDAAGRYAELKNLCVWAKTNAGMGSLFRSQHEFVFVFKNGTAAHINNIELGRFGRNRSNLWSYAGINAFGSDRDAELAMHPTVKPVAMVKDAILDCSRRNGIILDAFAGSGTTLIAAEKVGRRGYGIELDPHYVDTIIRRFSEVYGIDAVHVESQKTFMEMNIHRSSSSEGCHGREKVRKTKI